VASVSAFAAGTGTPAWTATIPGDAARITAPVSDGSRVFVGADVDSSSTVLALDVADGSVVWTAGPDDPASVASLVVTNGRLVAGFDSWRDPMAVDPSTGATIWSQHDQHFAAGSPLVTGDGRIVKQWTVPFDTNHPPILHFDLPHGEIIDSADGSLGFTWGSDVPEPAPSFYIAYGDSLIGTDGSGNTIAANGDDPYGDGWSAPVCCARATNGDVVLVGYGPPGWTALDLQDGATRYEIPAPAGMTGSSQPTFAASLLYVVTTDANGSTLRTFDAATGVAVSSLPVPITAASSRTSVIVANGRVYLTAGDSLHAYATA